MAAAVVDRRLPRGRAQRGRVAGHDVVTASRKTWSQLDARLAYAAHELGLVDARRRARAHDALEPLARELLAPRLGGGGAFGGLVPARPSAAGGARFEHAQAVPLLELAAHLLGARAVVPHVRRLAVLVHERDDDVHVIVAALGRAVAHRD